MLGTIRAITITCPDLDLSVNAYTEFLHYRPVLETTVSADLAALWGAHEQAAKRMVILQPEGRDACFIRLVESPVVDGYAPIRTWGWNAIEFIVEDTDTLAAQLDDSPFEMIGPPADLSFSDAIRATQLTGPGGEVIYLTMVKRPVDGFDLPSPSGRVGRPFIVILGGGLAEMQEYYSRELGVSEAPVMEAKVSVLSNAYGLPESQYHSICAVGLGGQSYIEMDQYPDAAIPRPTLAGHLPPGQCMVSFDCPVDSGMRGPVDPLYQGRQAKVITGAAGELIELIDDRYT